MSTFLSSSKKQTSYVLTPPPLFTYLDEKLSCCFVPLLKQHLSFLKSIQVQRILNYTGRKIEHLSPEWCEVSGIQLQDVNIDDKDFPRNEVGKFHEWLTMNVEDMIAQSSFANTLVVGSLDNHIASMVIACWRRTRDWSILSILAEFRQFTFPYKLRDYEQMIEYFNPGSVDLATLLPEWHVVNESIKEEEGKLVNRIGNQSTATEKDCEEQNMIDNVLQNLFLAKGNKLVNSTFDPSVRFYLASFLYLYDSFILYFKNLY